MKNQFLNQNNLKFETFVTDRLNECDDDEFEVSSSPISISGKPNHYASIAEELALKLITSQAMKVVGKTVFLYDEVRGCYQPIPNLQKWTYQVLDNEHRVKFRTRDLDEVATRLLFSPHVQANADDFNASPLKINLRNGIWDASTRKVSDHSPTTLFTYCIDSNYRIRLNGKPPEHPTFDKFCATSLEDDPLKKQLLLEIIGAILSDHPTKSAFFLLGESNSGKSVILSFLSRLLGAEMLASVPLHQLSSRFNLAELWGKKANISGEIKGKKLPDITVFKGITGNDLMQAEKKGRDPFTFRPRAKLIFAGNVLPDNSEIDNTDAFANRLVPLVFNVSIPKEQQDQTLLDKLWGERDAIVTDALNAFADWVKRGGGWTLPSDSTFRQAFCWNIIKENPMKRVRLPRKKKLDDSVDILTPDQVRRFLEFIKSEYEVTVKEHDYAHANGNHHKISSYTRREQLSFQLQLLFHMCICGGFRKGEILSLTWDDVNFETSEITINKSVVSHKGDMVSKARKTKGSVRTITLPDNVMEMIKQHKAQQKADADRLAGYWKENNLLFTRDDGTMMGYSTPYQTLKNVIKRYNAAQTDEAMLLPPVTLHGLRHTHASILLANNVNVVSVAARLGHSQTSTTLDTYAHAIQSVDYTVSSVLKNVLEDSNT